ncbi:hypothetical protein FCJ61_10150 [Burkholderia metallica]|uniref:hypothetical protein n=1 Tax=Burkholderia metallica TaxID=488729 RepID=UPI00157AFD16|nr:hypothetical protein [Burkholderia metallica]NTZ83348.1 hypothetical protein [Burkholderia metallica]
MHVRSDTDTLHVSYAPITTGFPIVETDTLGATLDAALEGGETTQAFFEQLNETAAFWADIADGTLSFVNGNDPHGVPVLIASSGNVDMRLIAEWSGATDISTPFGTMVVELGNRETDIQQVMAFTIRLDEAPAQGAVGDALFASLRPFLYSSFADVLKSMAAQLAVMADTEDPSIDPETFIVTVLSAASQKAISLLGSLAAWGLGKLFVDFDALAFNLSVVAPLMAVPLVLSYLAHPMYLSVLVINNSRLDFTLSCAAQPHGQASVNWPAATLPAISHVDFPLGEGDNPALLQTGLSQYINTNTASSIGIVLETDEQGGARSAEVVSVPWSGENAIWAGTPSASPGQTWRDHNASNGSLSYVARFADYTVRMATNKLQGETNGVYWYAVLIVIS